MESKVKHCHFGLFHYNRCYAFHVYHVISHHSVFRFLLGHWEKQNIRIQLNIKNYYLVYQYLIIKNPADVKIHKTLLKCI